MNSLGPLPTLGVPRQGCVPGGGVTSKLQDDWHGGTVTLSSQLGSEAFLGLMVPPYDSNSSLSPTFHFSHLPTPAAQLP